jgi:hypothetical protein
MHEFTSNAPPDIDELRVRLQKMPDLELRRFGEAAAYMCTPKANLGHLPLETYAVQLIEARLEWRRRQNDLGDVEDFKVPL